MAIDALRSAALEIARLTRDLEEARSHARRLCVALRAIRDEAAIGAPPLESRREDWEAAMNEADEVLGELEALYGERADDTEQSDVGTQGSGRERDHPRGRSSAPAPQ